MKDYVLIERSQHTPIDKERAILELLKGNRVESKELYATRLNHIKTTFKKDFVYFYFIVYYVRSKNPLT